MTKLLPNYVRSVFPQSRNFMNLARIRVPKINEKLESLGHSGFFSLDETAGAVYFHHNGCYSDLEAEAIFDAGTAYFGGNTLALMDLAFALYPPEWKSNCLKFEIIDESQGEPASESIIPYEFTALGPVQHVDPVSGGRW